MSEEVEEGAPSPKTAFILSAIYPGLGHVYNEKYLKALGYWAGATLLLAGYVQEGRRSDYWARESEAAGNAYEQQLYQARSENHAQSRRAYAWWTVAFFLVAAMDAYVDAHMFGFDKPVIEVSGVEHPCAINGNRGMDQIAIRIDMGSVVSKLCGR